MLLSRNKIHRFFFSTVFLFAIVFVNAQVRSAKIDSLWKIALKSENVVDKAAAYVELSELLGEDRIDTIPYFCTRVFNLLEGRNYSYKNEKKERIMSTLALAYNNMGVYFGSAKKLKDALPYFEKSVNYYKQCADVNKQIDAIINLGVTYVGIGDFKKALSYYDEGLNSSIKAKYIKGHAMALDRIGEIYYRLNEYDKSLEYRKQSLELAKVNGLKKSYLTALNNTANVYARLNNYKMAIAYYKEARGIAESTNQLIHLSSIYANIGDVFNRNGELDSAFHYLQKSIDLREKNKIQLVEMATSYNNLSRLYYSAKKYDLAIAAGEKSYQLAKASSNIIDKYQAKEVLSRSYYSTGEYQKAFEAYQEYNRLKDSVFSENNKRALIKREFELQMQQKEMESKLKADLIRLENEEVFKREELMSFHEKESQKLKLLQEKREMMLEENLKRKQMQREFNQKQELANVMKLRSEEKAREESKRQKLIIISVTIVVLLLSVFLYLLFRRFQVIKAQKELINEQKFQVEQQKHLVEEKNKEIYDSITYAKRLQHAILPPISYVRSFFKESFMLYKPKDIVAGDFYWMEYVEAKDQKIALIAVADSTGHGVPGAMVSVVCSNALNRAVKEFGLVDPGKILDKTRELVLETFSKSESNVADGMDISLCAFDLISNEIKWSGANNPLWYIHQNQFCEIKAHKQSIGKTADPTPFPTHKLKLDKGDEVFLITDGYADQFGGRKTDDNTHHYTGKKFKYKQLKELLYANYTYSAIEQQRLLEEVFDDWKGALEQIDDVSIIGIKI